jgi:hypothetical protein
MGRLEPGCSCFVARSNRLWQDVKFEGCVWEEGVVVYGNGHQDELGTGAMGEEEMGADR